jgi:prevent-host-death family protein
MEKVTASVADVKKQFSEYVNRSAFADCRVVITKRKRPVAAIVSMKDLQTLEQIGKRKGLLSVIRKWKDFSDLQDAIDEAVNVRHAEGSGRNVSL